MPRKAKKNAEPTDKPVPTTSDNTELTTASDAGLDRVLDREADARMKAVSQASSSGELEQLAEAADTFEQAYDDVSLPEGQGTAAASGDVPERAMLEIEQVDEVSEEAEDDEEDTREAPPVRLERLQKILSQAGIASRRHAEAMITEGRVQVNGQVVTELGTKADPGRDHIKVDGKLIHGAERLRYFVLNKPKGYVTTVSDPEGRPTVMQFFKKAGERLYPVGRLDYQSEGLLLVTNDGDLANKLTKAATGVEKTYLVKVSGQPTEDELDRLREGLAIDRGRPGEGRVHTAPAIIREARAGDNPWYEVVLTEGRNRELRKMFEEIGHHVEKIRRVGYGPLVLDVEPGQFRELEPDELAKLRLAAEGKWRKPKLRQTEQRKQAPRRDKWSAPPREDRRAAGDYKGRTYKREDQQQRTEWKKPRFERPAEPRPERAGRSEAPGRGAGRGFKPREEGARSADARTSPQRRPGEPGQKWDREGGAARPYQRPPAGGARKQGSGRAGSYAPRTGAPRPEGKESRGAFSRPGEQGQRWNREGGAPRSYQRPPAGGARKQGSGRAGSYPSKSAAPRREGEQSRGAFSRPGQPAEPRGRAQAGETGQGRSRGYQSQRRPSRFGEGGDTNRGKQRDESGRSQRRTGPPRGGRTAGGSGKPSSRGPAGGARGAGRRPSGRGPAGRKPGDRGRGR